MTRFPAVLLACGLLLPVASRADVAEKIIAKVNRDIITRTELEDATRAALETPEGGARAGADPRLVAAQVLDRLIQERLIVQAAAAEGMKVAESEVSPQVEQEEESVRGRFASDRDLEAALKKEGLTREDMHRRIVEAWRERYLLFKMVHRKQKEFETNADVADTDILAYFNAHKAEPAYQTDPMVHARHILFAVDGALTGGPRKVALAAAAAKVKAAKAALKRGEKFQDIATRLSEDGETREKGGDLGLFGKGTFHENLEKAAFALKPGQVSEAVESPVGLHLLLVEEALPPRPRTLDETIRVPAPIVPAQAKAPPEVQTMVLREYIRTVLRSERQASALQKWVDGLKAKALIQKFEAGPAGT